MGGPVLDLEGDLVQPGYEPSTAETGNMGNSEQDVVLGHLRLLAAGPINFQSLISFPRKNIFGDATNDSDDFLTTYIVSNLAGGHGVNDLNEVSDINRYEHGTLYARFPNVICKPPKVTVESDSVANTTGDDDRWWLGDLYYGAGDRYVGVSIVDGEVYTTESTVALGTMTNIQVTGKAVTFKGTDSLDRIFWPTGAGYGRVSQGLGFAETLASGTVPAAFDLDTLDQSLVALDTSGQLWHAENVSAGWTAYNVGVPTSHRPRRLVKHVNRQGEEALFVVTNRGVFQFMPDVPALIEIADLRYPMHATSGYAATAWNGDLYTSSKMGCSRYQSGSRSFMGLNRDHGLPLAYRGYIVDLVAGFNGMYALVNGLTMASIHEFNGIGWTQIWEGEGVIVKNSGVFSAWGEDKHRLYFTLNQMDADGDEVLSSAFIYLDLPEDNANPRAELESGAYAPGEYYLITGWYDANLRGYLKLANALEVDLEGMAGHSRFTAWYKVDSDDASWKLLGRSLRNGLAAMQFDDRAGDVSRGEIFQKIKFKFVLEDQSYDTPIIRAITFSCVKISYPAMTYTVNLDLTKPHNGMAPEMVHEQLKEIYEEGLFVPFVVKNKLIRVRMSQYHGGFVNGEGKMGSATFSVVEIPESLAKQWHRDHLRA